MKGRLSEIRERRPAPERERLTKQLCRTVDIPAGELLRGFRDQHPEPLNVELARFERDRIAGATRFDQFPRRASVTAERPAQPGDMHLHALRRARRRALGPEVVDDAVERDRLVCVQEEQSEERAWLASIDLDRPPVIADLERPEYQKLHSCFLA